MPREFLDSNVLIYAFTADSRAAAAQTLLERDCTISVQALNEFVNVARRKLGMNWDDVRDALAAIRILCHDVRTIDVETHNEAIRIAERYGYSIFDALVLAAAIRANCYVVWTEDMQHGAVIDGKLRIANPFAE